MVIGFMRLPVLARRHDPSLANGVLADESAMWGAAAPAPRYLDWNVAEAV